MPLAPVDLIAEAIVAQLNGAALSLPVTVERVPVIRFDLANLQTVRVQVMSAAETGTMENARDEATHEYEPIIAVVQKVERIENEFLDPLKYLVDEIGFYWVARELLDRSERWLETEIVAYPAERLVKEKLFISVLRLTFFGGRDHA